MTGVLGFWPQKSQLGSRESWSLEPQSGTRLWEEEEEETGPKETGRDASDRFHK